MNQYVHFDRFRFEPATARLWRDAREIKVTRKAAAVLELLVARAGQLVTKQTLFASVWGKTIVSDAALTTCIQELRKALGDDAKQPSYIETRHRSGYLFLAEVTKVHQPLIDEPMAPTQVEGATAVQLRITVQLIDIAGGYHTWSRRFERNRGDVFAIQDEIAETVATALRGNALSTAISE